MILHYLMPEDIELYGARLDVLIARIDAMKARIRRHARLPAGGWSRRLRQADRQCRSLRRLLFRLERSDARFHEKIAGRLDLAGGRFGEVTAQFGAAGVPDVNTIQIEAIDLTGVIPAALQPEAREKSMQTTR